VRTAKRPGEMDIGLTLPSFVRGADRGAILEWCRRVDEGPFSSISVGERIAYPSHELVTTLAFAAAATERVRIVSTVAVLPIHDPVRFAKQMATIDVLSGGRLSVGVGVGGRDQDYEALGVPFERRFTRLDEQVAIMQRVWRGEPIVDGLPPIGPEPVQVGGPPLLTASMGPKSLARSARWATGVAGFDLGPDPASVDATFRRAEEAWLTADRDDPPWLSTSSWFALGEDGPERLFAYAFGYLSNFGEHAAEAMAALCRLSDPGAMRETLAALSETGCSEIVLVPTTTDITELDRLLAVTTSR
jgi:alkanesulfonate monooxygenase SsuD/methylene tetrahydromethanopterin reductase-like flavin-dependent oxidoreductase (luciferase family)